MRAKVATSPLSLILSLLQILTMLMILYSDHQCLTWTYVCYLGVSSDCNTGMKFKYSKGDYSFINEALLNEDCNPLISSSNTDANWSALRICCIHCLIFYT